MLANLLEEAIHVHKCRKFCFFGAKPQKVNRMFKPIHCIPDKNSFTVRSIGTDSVLK